jgi:GNAT superfamily N-acetyltransferase
MRTRPARRDDLPACDRIFRAAVGDLYRRHSFEPPDPPRELFLKLHGHMLEHDPERFWVAATAGRVVGFGAAIVRADVWFLSALFVEPEEQASGVGKELLQRVSDARDRRIRRRLTIVDSFQPVSTGLYSRAGLLPVTPLLCLAGEPAVAAGSELVPRVPDERVFAELDAAAYGFDRGVDHAFWQREAAATLWLADGKPIAYSYRWPGGRIGPVAGQTGEAAAAALSAELHRAERERVSLIIPASARAALSAALEAGLRYTDPPGLILSTEPSAPDALVPYGYSLF